MYHLIARIIASITIRLLSHSPSLREQFFIIKDEHEILWTALYDIERMDKEGKMGQFAKRILDKLPNRYSNDR